MAARTEAQEEFDALVAKQSALEIGRSHPEDRRDEEVKSEDDEETTFRKKEVDDTMRLPAFDMRSGGFGFKLPDKSFDNESRTGVKGVIADARSYEEARRKGNRINGGKASGNGMVNNTAQSRRDDRARKTTSYLHSDSEDDETSPLEADTDDEDFLARWREARRLEIENEVGAGKDIRTRRTSPSARRYGRFDEVDALGYLDAIEKVGRETKVVVFVYDHECPVSAVIEEAIAPLVAQNPTIHFVRVHYEEIEFDNAGVPAVLAYTNQGDLFANLTYIVDQIPDDTIFDTDALKGVFRKWKIL